MSLKRILLSISSVVCLVQATLAIPAYPYARKVKQADGSWLTVVVKGDEFGHITLSDDGEPLCFNAKTHNYEFATLKDGKLAVSGVVASDASHRSAMARKFLASREKSSLIQAFDANRQQKMLQLADVNTFPGAKGVMQRVRTKNFPCVGEQHTLVILVEFSDQKFSTVGDDPQAFYTRMYNEAGFTHSSGQKGSARDFYMDSSFGLFQPTFDVIGPVVLPKSYAYYGEDVSGDGDSNARLAEFVKTACTLADPLVDYSKYDLDGDGIVDNIYFCYAGYGEADSDHSESIWPHSANYESLARVTGMDETQLVLDGKRIGSYACGNEIYGIAKTPTVMGIGTFVHEFGHVLGLTDHYDIYYNAKSFTPDAFDTMASGSYNNNAHTPPVFNAFERGELGWIDYIDMTTSMDSINVLPDLKDSNKAYRIQVDGTDGDEYFVLENRQKKGWDAYLPGHGMLLWHIDYDANAWKNNQVNIYPSHPRVDLVEADGKLTEDTRSGDPFPGTDHVTSYAVTSWGKVNILNLDDIEEKDDTIRVLLGGTKYQLDPISWKVKEIGIRDITVSWSPVKEANKYIVNVYQQVDGVKTLAKSSVFRDCVEGTVDGLLPNTDYEVEVLAGRGSYVSPTQQQVVHTQNVPFKERVVSNLAVTEKTAGGFTASWDAIEDADDYLVTLTKMEYAAEGVADGYDFSSNLSGLPSDWETNASIASSPYGVAAPSLRMNQNDQYLKVAYSNKKLSGIQFYLCTSRTAKGELFVEVYKNHQWENIATIAVDDESKAGKVYDYDFALCDSVRMRVERTAGSFSLDDVYAKCHSYVIVPVPDYSQVSTSGNTTYSFKGLDHGCTYILKVCGKMGDELSAESNELRCELAETTGISSVMASGQDTPAVYYDLSGRRIPGIPQGHGIYIVKHGDKKYKVKK